MDFLNLDKSGWKKTSFGEVCRNLNITERDPLAAGLDRYIGLEHIEPENLHLKSWGNVADGTTFTKTFRPGHVLFGKRRAYQKKAAVADFAGICSGDILVLEAIEEVIDPRFFPFLVTCDRFFEFAVQTSAGSLSPRTKFQDLAQFQFRLPPKAEQARLAALLWSGDGVGEGYLGVLEELERVKSIFAKTNFEVVEQKLLLKELAKVTSGGTPDRKNPDFWNGDIAWVKTTEIDYVDLYTSEEFITELGMKNSAAKIIPKNSLLMAMYGQGITRGRVARLKINAAVNQACAAIILKDEHDLDYLYFFFQYAYEAIRELAQGANQQNLSGEIIKNLEIPFPEIKKRDEIVFKLNELDKKSAGLKKMQTQTKTLQTQLLHQIFSQ